MKLAWKKTTTKYAVYLWNVMRSGKMRALVDFQRLRAYERRDTGLTAKTFICNLLLVKAGPSDLLLLG